jgi:hypothetical protein
LEGIEHGFHIIDPDSVLENVEFANHNSAVNGNVKLAVEKLIVKEIVSGNYIISNEKPTIISALGSVPKSDGGLRLIHDCSLPVGKCVNSYTPTLDKYSYESIDNAVSFIKPGSYLAKVDIKSAYRNVPIHPRSQEATGLQWTFENGEHCYFYDRKLPFGGRASPSIFHRMSQAVKRVMANRGFTKMVAYLDDFLLIGDTFEECDNSWKSLKELLTSLGFPLNDKKLIAPVQKLDFLGITIDTKSCTLSLPNEKLVDIRVTLREFLCKNRLTKLQLQRIAGKLNFAAKCVRGARTFLRRILNGINVLKRPHHKLKVQGAIRHDFEWWYNFVEDFNGVVPFIDDRPVAPIITDACGLGGGGLLNNGDFFYVNWQTDHPDIANLPINYKETVTAALAVIRWGHLCKNRIVHLFIDNQCAVSLMNKCAAKSAVVMSILRKMFWLSVKFNFVVKAFYVPGECNEFADAVSRLHEQGQVLRFEALWNNQFGVIQQLHCNHLANHMSLGALCVIFPQVLQWRRQRGFWTPM